MWPCSLHSHCEWAVTGGFNPLQACCWDLSPIYLHSIYHSLPSTTRCKPINNLPSFNPTKWPLTITLHCHYGWYTHTWYPLITAMCRIFQEAEINNSHNDFHKFFINTRFVWDLAWVPSLSGALNLVNVWFCSEKSWVRTISI